VNYYDLKPKVLPRKGQPEMDSKKLTQIVVVLAALLAVPALADQAPQKGTAQQGTPEWGMAGCGLGTYVFSGKGNWPQLFAATTNGTSINQSFGISTGTLNCDPANGSGSQAAAAFIYANREALEKDIARGNGETLSSLTHVLGCSNGSVVGRKLQGNFGKIFPSQDVSTDQVVKSIMGEVRIDPSIAAQCLTIS
jgi:hypothetical protein